MLEALAALGSLVHASESALAACERMLEALAALGNVLYACESALEATERTLRALATLGAFFHASESAFEASERTLEALQHSGAFSTPLRAPEASECMLEALEALGSSLRACWRRLRPLWMFGSTQEAFRCIPNVLEHSARLWQHSGAL